MGIKQRIKNICESRVEDRMSKLNDKTQGFTLLELLLVLALASILILGALAMYQIQLRNFKVDKTSLQTQQWLQAGMSFYVDCNKWPNDSIQDPNIVSAMMGESPLTQDECPRYANTIRQYMPIGSDKNGPFPNDYSFGPFNDSGTMFQVSTDIGSDSVIQESIGKMIVGRLPNATSSVDSSKTPETVVVQSTVNVPGQSIQNNKNVIILGMQMVMSKKQSNIKQPTDADCPAGMKAIVVNAISNFQSTTDGNGNKHGAYLTATQASATPDQLITPVLTVTNSENDGGAQQDVGANEVLLISACIPKEGK
jgi:prepilin-type N-terminal cleavage/methylation domain-containing protein